MLSIQLIKLFPIPAPFTALSHLMVKFLNGFLRISFNDLLNRINQVVDVLQLTFIDHGPQLHFNIAENRIEWV